MLSKERKIAISCIIATIAVGSIIGVFAYFYIRNDRQKKDTGTILLLISLMPVKFEFVVDSSNDWWGIYGESYPEYMVSDSAGSYSYSITGDKAEGYFWLEFAGTLEVKLYANGKCVDSDITYDPWEEIHVSGKAPFKNLRIIGLFLLA